VAVKYGTLNVKQLVVSASGRPSKLRLSLNGSEVPSSWKMDDSKLTVSFNDIAISEGQAVTLKIDY
jgi:hypothetical protein